VFCHMDRGIPRCVGCAAAVWFSPERKMNGDPSPVAPAETPSKLPYEK